MPSNRRWCRLKLAAKPFTPVQFRAWPPLISENLCYRVNQTSTEESASAPIGLTGMASKIDDNERTNPVGLFNTARSYWRSAEQLTAAPLKVTHPQAPITFLFCHALELYLKAYLLGIGHSLADLKQKGHRVASLAKEAIKYGLEVAPEHAEVLDHIQDTDIAIEARYIVTGFKQLPTNEALSNVTEALDRTVCLALIEAGHPVREEKFVRPTPPQRETSLGEETVRVLLHMFRTPRLEDRDVGAIARALNLERGVLEYHLDRLADAKLAETAGGNYLHGHVYWALTSKGRQHAVERTQGSV
jgi:DNA-binding transcriptional ArsR family regulator